MTLVGTDRGAVSDNTSASTVSFSPSGTIARGSMAVLKLAHDNSGSGGADPYSSIADSLGNTWVSRVNRLYDPVGVDAGICIRVFTCEVEYPITTSDTVTITFTGNVTAKAACFEEWSCNAGFAVIYQSGNTLAGAATGTPSIVTNSVAITDAVSCAGAAESSDTWAGDADATNGAWSVHQHTVAGSGATGVSITSQRKIVTGTATQTYNPTLTSADCTLAWILIREVIQHQRDPMGSCGQFGV